MTQYRALPGPVLAGWQDGLLAEKDEKLPFAGHVVGYLQHLDFIKDFVSKQEAGSIITESQA